MDPSGSLYPHPTPQEEAELNSPYYLVVIRGRFPLAYAVHSHPHARIGGPHQSRGTPAVPRVLELLLSAHPGYGLSGFSYGPSVHAPLRLLGPVTRLV